MYRRKSEVTNKYVHLLHQDMIKQNENHYMKTNT